MATRDESTVRTAADAGEGPLKLLVTGGGPAVPVTLPALGTVVVGRGIDADVKLDDASLSRRHAAIHMGGGRVEVEDLGSTNGCWIQGMQIESGARAPLALGEALRLGDVVLLIHREAVVDRIARPLMVEQVAVDDSIIVESPAMKQLHETVGRIAAGPISVLLLGETGVGKDVTARLVHAQSPRCDEPFIPINCAALPANLVESELFGHDKGAFTGADAAKIGLLERADNGTVFFDEVGELPLAMQAKLLRVIEDQQVTRVGGKQPRPIDVRFVSATNRDLEEQVSAGEFRQDLFFRLNGVSLVVPPLRERPEEIALLAHSFIESYSQRLGRPTQPKLAADALHWLSVHPWPGNIRELRNIIERAVLLCPDDNITVAHLPAPKAEGMAAATSATATVGLTTAEIPAPAAGGPVLRGAMDDYERERIVAALEACGGNQTRAAKMLGISRRALSTKLDKHNLPRPRKN